MGIITRLMEIFRQKSNKVLDRIEDPLEKLELEIKDLDRDILEIRKSIAPVLGKNTRVEREIDNNTKELVTIETDLNNALKANNDSEARSLLIKRHSIQTEIEAMTNLLQDSKNNIENVMQNIAKMEGRLKELKTYRSTAQVKLANAEATKKISTILMKTSSNIEGLSLDSVEEIIERKEDEALGLAQIAESKTVIIESIDRYNVDEELALLKIKSK